MTVDFEKIRFGDLNHLIPLGNGGFGKVYKVKVRNYPEQTFALKKISKNHNEKAISEAKILFKLNCDFIVDIFKLFQDKTHLYILMEICICDLWMVLQKKCLYNNTVRFYVACVTKALDYLHSRNIIFRDLKPENLLLDKEGYVKLTDFGCAKQLTNNQKTRTLCGTRIYYAPELVYEESYNKSVDYWCLGVLIFELLTGSHPFARKKIPQTFCAILRGIDSVSFPKSVKNKARDIVKKLCRSNPDERLGFRRGGIREIQKHGWFNNLDWQGLENRSLSPPISPNKLSGIVLQNRCDVFY